MVNNAEKAGFCPILLYFICMGVLEIVGEDRLGAKILQTHPEIRRAFEKADLQARKPNVSANDKRRIAALVELCFEYERETDSDEKENILRTLSEISANEPLEVPKKTLEEWEAGLIKSDKAYGEGSRMAEQRIQSFLKKYFSLRAKAGLATQSAVAKASGLKRGYIAVIETGEHYPQQKTLQKLAKAFAVDVADLIS